MKQKIYIGGICVVLIAIVVELVFLNGKSIFQSKHGPVLILKSPETELTPTPKPIKGSHQVKDIYQPPPTDVTIMNLRPSPTSIATPSAKK